MIGIPQIIGVQECDPLGSRTGNARISRGRNTCMWLLDEDYIRKLTSYDVDPVIGRSVINDDRLTCSISLSNYRINGRPDPALQISKGDDNRKGRISCTTRRDSHPSPQRHGQTARRAVEVRFWPAEGPLFRPFKVEP